MKKVFIALLVIAGGIVAFFLFRKKTTKQNGPDETLIIGTWKTIPSVAGDSTLQSIVYDFRKNGELLQVKGDSSRPDTSYYKWDREGRLLLSVAGSKEADQALSIVKLTQDTLQVTENKNDSLTFIRVK